MPYKKTIIGVILAFSLVLSGQAFAEWQRTEIAYWGASGTAFCNNYQDVHISVKMSYLRPDDALSALWSQAFTACQYRGGLYNFSGRTHSQWRPVW
ncbi:hypothetical protein VU12_03050 [Desulfobulbus sp. US4]|nr:hypothetical protein [Desulfobulbus sp. US4]